MTSQATHNADSPAHTPGETRRTAPSPDVSPVSTFRRFNVSLRRFVAPSLRRFFTVAAVLLPWPVAASADDPFANNACVRCHENQAGQLGQIVREWKNSVHFANGVGCDGCHGGDATVRAENFPRPDDFKDASHLSRDPRLLTAFRSSDQFVSKVRGREVSYFCGKCHTMVKEKHLGSPHGDNGDPTCLYCHARRPDGYSTHEILTATLDIIDTRGQAEGGRCSPCHQAPTMQAVGQIKETLARTATTIDKVSTQYEQLVHRGYRSIQLAELAEHGREVHSRLRRVFHSFNMREINDFVGEITALAERTQRTQDLLDQVVRQRRMQTIVGLGVCAFLLCFAALLLYYKRRFCLHDASDIVYDTPAGSQH